MRINKFIALASGLSRRAADAAIEQGRVEVDSQPATTGQSVTPGQRITLDSKPLRPPAEHQTIIFNKPTGVVVSRNGQGNKTIYELLPPDLHKLKAIGRLDKDSSGLLLLTDDGALAHELTHPSYQKIKQYEVALDKPLAPLHRQMIADIGVQLEDGRSKLGLARQSEGDDSRWIAIMHEGRNRQIRRTFAALGYEVTRLHRTQFGNFHLHDIPPGKWQSI